MGFNERPVFYYLLKQNDYHNADENYPPTVVGVTLDYSSYIKTRPHFVYETKHADHVVINPDRLRFSVQWLIACFVAECGFGKYRIVRPTNQARRLSMRADRSKVTNPHENIKQRRMRLGSKK